MEYALKAEDIGNSAMSEDNTNKPQNDYGSYCVYGDCDRKSDGEDSSDGDTTRDDGCDAADGNSCDAEVTNNHDGLQFMMAMMSMMTMIVSMVIERVMVRIVVMVRIISDGDTKRGDGCNEYDDGDGNSSHNSSSGDNHTQRN